MDLRSGVVDAAQQHCEPFTDSEHFGVDGQLIWRILRDRVAGLANVMVAEGVECTGLTQDAEVLTLTGDGQPVRAAICERDVDKARARDAKLLAEVAGAMKRHGDLAGHLRRTG
jgi:hypothetical protein